MNLPINPLFLTFWSLLGLLVLLLARLLARLLVQITGKLFSRPGLYVNHPAMRSEQADQCAGGLDQGVSTLELGVTEGLSNV